MGKIEKYFNDKIKDEGALFLSLIDPDNQNAEKSGEIARISYENGADAILVGGSIGAQGEYLDDTVKNIKKNASIPVVLFPGNIATLTPYADAVYFMTLMNSKDTYWSSTAQIQGAPIVKKMDLEPIPTGYIILEPGMAVGWISNANLVPRKRPDLAAATALACQYTGSRLIVTDSGSGAPSPAPKALIKAVSDAVDIPYVYGGGIKNADHAYNVIKSGADGVQIGTAFEVDENMEESMAEMSKAIKKAGKEKLKENK